MFFSQLLFALLHPYLMWPALEHQQQNTQVFDPQGGSAPKTPSTLASYFFLIITIIWSGHGLSMPRPWRPWQGRGEAMATLQPWPGPRILGTWAHAGITPPRACRGDRLESLFRDFVQSLIVAFSSVVESTCLLEHSLALFIAVRHFLCWTWFWSYYHAVIAVTQARMLVLSQPSADRSDSLMSFVCAIWQLGGANPRVLNSKCRVL